MLPKGVRGLPVQSTTPISSWSQRSSPVPQRWTSSIPRSRDPKDPSETRFRTMGYPEEWIEAYHPGGLHPIHVGDTLRDGRYQILRKLGYGAESTTWLVQDKVWVLQRWLGKTLSADGVVVLLPVLLSRSSARMRAPKSPTNCPSTKRSGKQHLEAAILSSSLAFCVRSMISSKRDRMAVIDALSLSLWALMPSSISNMCLD